MKKLFLVCIALNVYATQELPKESPKEKPCVTSTLYNSKPYPPPPIHEKYVIGAWHAGLFSSFFVVLTHLAWCERNNKIPVVHWGNKSLYYQPEGYNGSKNAWEYYFEPVSHLSYVEGDPQYSYYWAIDNTCFVIWNFNELFREKAHRIIQKYIRIKPIVQKKIDAFYNEKMKGKRVIGLHIRGTDKFRDEKPVPLHIVTDYANTFVDGNTYFLLATEDVKIFENAKKLLKGPVIFYDTHRSTSTQGGWWAKLPNRAELGEEVLIEAQLLSRCNLLLHTYMSNVSAAVLCFNPSMPHKVFRANQKG